MKKLFAVLLALLMVFTLVGCSSSKEETPAPAEGGEETAAEPKVGVILVGDENEGYTYAHIFGIREACKALGIADDKIIWKYNIPEDQTCYDMAVDLVENGATLVISNSYGHQSFMQQAAAEYPEVTFLACTGDSAAVSGLANFKNAFPQTYQSRYVSGVVAGMKIKELADAGALVDQNFDENGKVKVGYVGAFPYAEVVSGYTGFFLGLRSVYPDAVMYVKYTNSWFDVTAEATVGDELMSQGWERLYEYVLKNWLDGSDIVTDWTAGYEDKAVMITELGKACAPGTAEAVAEAEDKIVSGELHVFDASTFTIGGETPTSILGDVDADFTPETECLIDGYFHESEFRSAPYFAARIDGITELN